MTVYTMKLWRFVTTEILLYSLTARVVISLIFLVEGNVETNEQGF